MLGVGGGTRGTQIWVGQLYFDAIIIIAACCKQTEGMGLMTCCKPGQRFARRQAEVAI